jgi:hypothetical protein
VLVEPLEVVPDEAVPVDLVVGDVDVVVGDVVVGVVVAWPIGVVRGTAGSWVTELGVTRFSFFASAMICAGFSASATVANS